MSDHEVSTPTKDGINKVNAPTTTAPTRSTLLSTTVPTRSTLPSPLASAEKVNTPTKKRVSVAALIVTDNSGTAHRSQVSPLFILQLLPLTVH